MKKIQVDRCLTEVSTVSPLALRNIMNMDVETVNPTTAMVRTAVFFIFLEQKTSQCQTKAVNIRRKLTKFFLKGTFSASSLPLVEMCSLSIQSSGEAVFLDEITGW